MEFMADYEKLGVFYLGKRADNRELLLYDSKDLVTHAAKQGSASACSRRPPSTEFPLW
jgi:hypothetical protein